MQPGISRHSRRSLLRLQEKLQRPVTFFAVEVFEELCHALKIPNASPSSLRRNVITRGIDLNTLIGQEFEVQGVRFYGTGECRPCYWMNRAIAPGAEDFLKGRGGLRAEILSNGILRGSSRCLAAA